MRHIVFHSCMYICTSFNELGRGAMYIDPFGLIRFDWSYFETAANCLPLCCLQTGLCKRGKALPEINRRGNFN